MNLIMLLNSTDYLGHKNLHACETYCVIICAYVCVYVYMDDK